MPPKVKIEKEEIIRAAIRIVRENGAGALNARALAKRLCCSTQPIYSNFATMKELQDAVIKEAKRIYQQRVDDAMAKAGDLQYRASGLAYIRFAAEEKELFKLLFMRDRTGEEIPDETDELSGLLSLVSQKAGIGMDEAMLFHLEMWIYVHGIAAMSATGYLNLDDETVSRVMSDAFFGLLARYQHKEE